VAHGIRSCFSTVGRISGVRQLEDVAAFEFVAEFFLAGEDEAGQ
jgi:hypothetical protein